MSETGDIRKVGYIGLGIMGAAMAGNLLKAGYELVVWNRTASKAQPLADAGATVAGSAQQVAAAKPAVVFLNVTDTTDVEAVLFGEAGVVAGAEEGLIVVDNSTISPIATQAFASRLAERGITLIDAPVSGGDTGAKAGTLSIMVGGPDDAVRRVWPLLEVMGRSITHVGDVGMGQTCKACNQIAVACNLLGVVEAMAMAKKSGLDLGKMIQVVSGGAAGSWQLANLGPKIASGDHDPGFMVDYILKDLGIVQDAGRTHRLPLAGTAVAETLFRAASAAGHGQLGTQAMAKAMESLADLTFNEQGA